MERRGFTLVELLVVISIILLVSVVALPSIVSGLGDRTLVSSVQALQGSIIAARDGAVLSGSPQGLRLMPSATDPTLFDRVVPLIVPPDYRNGLVSIYPSKAYAPAMTGGLPCLVLEESPAHWEPSGTGWLFVPNEPTSWYHNIRLGDRISINGSKPYVVCGPRATISDDLTVNADPMLLLQTYTAPDGTTTAQASPEYLLLVNGIDDAPADGFVDNGWDGVDNDLLNGVDDAGEWETEVWTSAAGVNLPYLVTRRPVPGKPQAIVPLLVPVSLAASVVDPTATPPVPTLYVSPLTGSIDLMIRPDGTVDISGPYAAPSGVSLARSMSRFVLSDAQGHQRSLTLWHRTGLMEADVTAKGHFETLP
jgi:prepilin-type N-terminal cleavage/methylation domain-containing protein